MAITKKIGKMVFSIYQDKYIDKTDISNNKYRYINGKYRYIYNIDIVWASLTSAQAHCRIHHGPRRLKGE